MESATHALFEAACRMDWWLYAAWAMILEKCDDEAKCCSLFDAGARTQMMVAHISLILWTNTAQASGCYVV